MKTPQEIKAELPNFYGTEHWYRYSPLFPNMLLTDGAKYVAEACEAYWLMDIIGSYLPRIPKNDGFAVALLTKDGVNKPGALFVLGDDMPPDTTYATQAIEYTDFPLDEIKLYVIYDGENWTVLLPGEY